MACTTIAPGYKAADSFSVAGVHQYRQGRGMVDSDFRGRLELFFDKDHGTTEIVSNNK